MSGTERWTGQRVFLYRHPVDMRKQIDSLAALVAYESDRNPADRCLYVFTNKGRNNIKLLIWHLNGYWLLYEYSRAKLPLIPGESCHPNSGYLAASSDAGFPVVVWAFFGMFRCQPRDYPCNVATDNMWPLLNK